MHNTLRLLQPIPLLQLTALLQAIQLVDIFQPLWRAGLWLRPRILLRVPSCRSALGWLWSRLLCRRRQMASPYPVRAVQRNLHHQLLRSGVLITGSSRAGMPDARARHEGIREELAAAVKEKPRPVRGFLCLFVHRRALNRRQATALVSWPSISPILIADSVTPTVSRQKDGKLRIVYAGWDNAKVVQVHEVLELRAS